MLFIFLLVFYAFFFYGMHKNNKERREALLTFFLVFFALFLEFLVFYDMLEKWKINPKCIKNVRFNEATNAINQ